MMIGAVIKRLKNTNTHRSINRLAGMLAISCALVTSHAQAKAEESPGHHQPGSVQVDLGLFITDLRFSDPGAEAGLFYQINPHWGIEARLGIPGNDLYSDPPYSERTIAGVPLTGDPDVLSVSFNVLYNFHAGNRISPHLGFGFSSVELDNYQSSSAGEHDLQARVIAGFRYWFTGRFFSRFDLSGIYSLDEQEFRSDALLGLGLALGAIADPEVPVEVVEEADDDRDGVLNSTDRCPNTPFGVSVDRFGCPLDTDGDQVADHLDKCPGTPPGTVVDTSGCPLDSDMDGVADAVDRCPNTPPGALVDANGCLRMPADAVPLRILFPFDRALVGEDVHDVEKLDTLLIILDKYSYIDLIIAGHTDNVGPYDYNIELSQLRAQRVLYHLIDNYGIDPSRVSIRRYGDTRPIADNSTAEGRRQNRRVQIIPTIRR